MKNMARGLACLMLIVLAGINVSCKKDVSGHNPEISDALDPIEEVVSVPSGENVTITVNRNSGNHAYFSIGFSGIKENMIIDNTIRDGWCIDIRTPINRNNAVYEGIKLYSTFRVRGWQRINYLFNMKDQLMASDPNLTWREFQLVIWSLRLHPQFKLDEVAVEDLPSEMQNNGEPRFNREKVKELLDMVESGYQDFIYEPGDKYAVIIETPADVQTLITFVE